MVRMRAHILSIMPTAHAFLVFRGCNTKGHLCAFQAHPFGIPGSCSEFVHAGFRGQEYKAQFIAQPVDSLFQFTLQPQVHLHGQ